MSTDELHDFHGHHAVWCTDADEGLHADDQSYCERMVGGIDGVIEPNWTPAQVWVHNIRPFIHGRFTADEHVALEKNRTGIQLAVSRYDETITDDYKWVEELVNIKSGDARTLAAQLIAAADITDGITRWNT